MKPQKLRKIIVDKILDSKYTIPTNDFIKIAPDTELPSRLIKHWSNLVEAGMGLACKPLEEYGITYFLYVKRFRDGSQIELTNHISWSEYYYKNRLYSIGPFKQNKHHYDEGTFLWSAMPYQEVYQNLREQFQIDHGITLVNKFEDCNEFFHFAGLKGNYHLVNLYLNQPNILRRFILYFKDKMADLIKMAEKTKIMLHHPSESIAEPELFCFGNIINDRLSDSMPIDRYFISEFSDVYITRREFECLKWHVMGKTAAEIGIILAITKRTVEAHLESSKRKLNCYKQSQLGYKLADLVELL